MSLVAGNLSTRHVAALVAVALLLSTGPSLATSPGAPDLRVERVTRTVDIPPGAELRVVNRHGDVRLRFGGYGDRAEILAHVQQLPPADPPLLVQVVTGADAVTIEPRAAGGGPSDPADRADLAILVPAGTAVAVVTDRGLVEARGLRSDLDVESVAGDVVVSGTCGRLQLATERGEVSVVLEPAADARESVIRTATGGIVVSTAGDLAVDIATSGSICSDFSTEISHHPNEEPDTYATVRIGRATGQLRIRSLRGAVSLERRPVLDPAPASGRNER